MILIHSDVDFHFFFFVFLFLSDQIVYTDNINNLSGYMLYRSCTTTTTTTPPYKTDTAKKNEGLFTRETPLKKPQATVHNLSDKNI